MQKIPSFFITIIFTGLIFSSAHSQNVQGSGDPILLKDSWKVQRSELIRLSGEAISSPGTDTRSWYPAIVPSTVMGVLTRSGLYRDLFKGENYKTIDKSPFEDSWWYRNEFDLKGLISEQHVFLNFDGLNYYANIWLNGRLIASRDTTFGTYRRYSLDITALARENGNVLAVEIFKALAGDFNLGFVDWNPRPPDENMGIWRAVSVSLSRELKMENLCVRSVLNYETFQDAALTVMADLTNLSGYPLSCILRGKMEGLQFSYAVEMAAGESKTITLTPEQIPGLRISSPRVWWCTNLGKPELYHLELDAEVSGHVAAGSRTTFGIRDIRVYKTADGHKGFMLNGKKLLIRGAGWTDDLFLRDSLKSLEQQIQYVKHMNLNTLRFESIWGTSHEVYDLCDQYGILAMVGWSCQWEWDEYLGKACDDFGGIQSEDEMNLALKSFSDQVYWLRNHPSIFVWLVGSDKCPRPELEVRYIDLFSRIDDRPYLASAGTRVSTVSGPTGVKMNGPYEYVAPVYWYADTINGGAFGFNTETGPGPQMPVMESVRKMIPEAQLWPLNSVWNYHCTHSIQAFNTLDVFNKALFARYGEPRSVEEYVLKSEVQCYEALRPMYEAFRVRLPKTTGIIQWMLNSAWPSVYWQLYDYYLLPTSAYYAARTANQPVQAIYDYANRSIYLVNEQLYAFTGGKVKVEALDKQCKSIGDIESDVNCESGTSRFITSLDEIPNAAFLSIRVTDNKGEVVASNFYWLSDRPDEFAWDKTYWAFTPMKSYADLTYLNALPETKVRMTAHRTMNGQQEQITVHMENPSQSLAFFLELALVDGKGNQISPVFWNDNYISLMPGEKRTLECQADGSLIQPGKTSLRLIGWNTRKMEQIIR